MESSNQVVARKEDSWIEVPAERFDGFRDGPLELRPGADESKVRVKVPGTVEHEVAIDSLEAGIAAIREEHAR